MDETGCDAVMIGRAAEGNPWIFRQILSYLETGEILAKPSLEEVKEMMLRHAKMQMDYKGEVAGMREMRKHIAWYTAGYPNSSKMRAAVNEIESLEQLEKLLEKWREVTEKGFQ